MAQVTALGQEVVALRKTLEKQQVCHGHIWFAKKIGRALARVTN